MKAVIAEHGFSEWDWSTGHGAGMDILEEPFFGPDSQVLFEPGMTFYIEPMIVPDPRRHDLHRGHRPRHRDRMRGADDEREADMVSNDANSTPRGEHAFDLLVTNASAVLGGVRNEQYRVARRHARSASSASGSAWIGPTAELAAAPARRRSTRAGSSPSPA